MPAASNIISLPTWPRSFRFRTRCCVGPISRSLQSLQSLLRGETDLTAVIDEMRRSFVGSATRLMSWLNVFTI
jgi:hypothetical protein